MEPEVQKNKIKLGKKGVVPIILAVFIFLMFSTAIAFTVMTLQNENIYKGVRIGNINASGMSRQELKKALDSAYQVSLDKLGITLKAEKAELKAGYPELHVHYDTEAAAEKAYAIGHSGNIFERLREITSAGTSGKTLDMPLTFDQTKLDSFVDHFYNMTLIKVCEGALLITDSNVTLRSGHHGENIDKDKVAGQIREMILERKSGTLRPEVTITAPLKFKTDELYSQISSKPVNATYKLVNGTLTLVPHVYGREIDKAGLTTIAQELDKTEDTERVLPVTLTKPAITSDMATSMLFRDVLASFSSHFSTATQNGKNRGFNMGIAAAKINNLILAPGDEFSYNKVVGPRDLEHGFKLAHVYSAGKIIDGVGGGICQVSSTMYNTILKADLKVVERRNHSFTVGYVPLGQDATAYYGGTDFRFINSTNWPIKLSAAVKGNQIFVSIQGTNEAPNKTVLISQKILSKTPYTVKYIDDPTLPAGSLKEQLPGQDGYVVETYKTIKMDGNVVSQTKLHTSVYKAFAQEMLRGTKNVSGTATTTAPSVKSAQVSTGADKTGNAKPKETSPAKTANPTKAASPEKSVSPEKADGSGKVTEPAEPATEDQASPSDSSDTQANPESTPAPVEAD